MKNECEIVNDLLPNYVESLVSEETKKFVNEHIKSCEKCKKKLEILKEDKNKKQRREREEQKIEIDHLKKYNKKMLFLKIPLFTIIIAFIILAMCVTAKYYYNGKILDDARNKIEEISVSNNYHIYETQFYKFDKTKEENYYNTEIFYKDGKYKKIEKINSVNSKLENKETVKYWAKDEFLKKDRLHEYEAYNQSGELTMRMPNIYFGEGIVKILNNIILNIRTDEFRGIQCYVLKNSDKSSYREIWIDKETMLPIREVQNIYGEQYDEKTFFIEFNIVTEKDVTKK